MPFISLKGAKNAYFMTGGATNEIYIFSLHKMKQMTYSFQKFEFSFLYTILSVIDFFALNGVIHFHTLRHINDDVA